MPHLNNINEPVSPSFSDNNHALNVNSQIISLTNMRYIQLLTELTSHTCGRTPLWVGPLNPLF